MSLQFTLKPHTFDIITPRFLLWLWRYGIAAIIVYFLAGFTDYQTNELIIALTSTVIIASILSIKHALIKVHTTKYSFYDTHVVEEQGIILKKRNSMPYKQINKVINETNLWNRLSGASDIVLQSAHHHDLRLRSIKNADEIENRIYNLLREKKE